jgi:hypothetical protein
MRIVSLCEMEGRRKVADEVWTDCERFRATAQMMQGSNRDADDVSLSADIHQPLCVVQQQSCLKP